MFDIRFRFLPLLAASAGVFFVLSPHSLAVEYSDTEVLVQFSEGRSPTASVQALHDIDTVERLSPDALTNIPESITNMYAVTPQGKQSVDDLVDSLQADPRVEKAELNPLYELTAVPDDTYFGDLWAMQNTGIVGVEDADIDATDAWDVTTDAANVVVAVIDTGIDYNHPDLADNMWVNPGETPDDGIDNDGNGYVDDVYGYDFYNRDSDPYDDHSHGTHVAGTIGAVGNNDTGVTGVTWDVQLAALKVCGTQYCSGSAIIEAVAYAAAMGMPISNNSYGGGGYSSIVQAGIDEAGESANHLYIAAAGNASNDNDKNPFYPASYDSDYILSVASTTRSDVLSSFSNYGATSVDIAAPGSSIRSTTPSNGYGYKSGTSMAAPHVAGAAALLLGYDDTLTPLQLRSAIVNSGDELVTLTGKTVNDSRLNVANAIIAVTDNAAPTADITADNTEPTTEDLVNFDASSSSDPDGDMLTFQWNFGNGESAGPLSTPTAALRFAIPGTYTVTVTVSDEIFEDTATITLQVAAPSEDGLSEIDEGEESGGDSGSGGGSGDDMSNPDGVMIDWLVWEKKPGGKGWRVRWEASGKATRIVQLIRKSKKRTVVLKKWNRTGKQTLPASKVQTYLKNHPDQFRKRKQLRMRLVVRSNDDKTLRARKSARIPRNLYKD